MTMQAFIAVMGILVTMLVVAGMILIAPAGAEPENARETAPVLPAAVPLAGDAAV